MLLLLNLLAGFLFWYWYINAYNFHLILILRKRRTSLVIYWLWSCTCIFLIQILGNCWIALAFRNHWLRCLQVWIIIKFKLLVKVNYCLLLLLCVYSFLIFSFDKLSCSFVVFFFRNNYSLNIFHDRLTFFLIIGYKSARCLLMIKVFWFNINVLFFLFQEWINHIFFNFLLCFAHFQLSIPWLVLLWI